MACNQPSQQEWTIDMVLDSPTDTDPRTLVFCLNVGDKITGNVDILSQDGVAVSLSEVTGTKRVLEEVTLQDPQGRVSLMTLNFTWGDTQVILSGNTFPLGSQNRFAGHFRAFASQTAAPAPEDEGSAPRANDTGTGTGTQT